MHAGTINLKYMYGVEYIKLIVLVFNLYPESRMRSRFRDNAKLLILQKTRNKETEVAKSKSTGKGRLY